MKKRLLPLLLVPVLSACNDDTRNRPRPTPISLEDDPRILRGVWTGQLRTSDADAGPSLRLDLNATYVKSSEYAVSGSAAVGTQAWSVSGTVAGGALHSYLRAQTSPAPSVARLSLLGADGKTANTLLCTMFDARVTQPAWSCTPDVFYQNFTLKRENP